MNKKRWFALAAILILAGIVGMAVNHFKFGEELVAYEKRWELADAEVLKHIKISGNMPLDIAFATSTDTAGSISFKGSVKAEHADILNAFHPSGTDIELDLNAPQALELMSVQIPFPKGRLTVMLPESAELENLELSVLSDNIRLDGAAAGRIGIKLTSGDISMNEVAAGELSIENVAGDIRGTGIRAATTVVNRTGNIRLKDLEGPVDINLTSGDVNLELIGISPVSVTGTSGDVNVRPDAAFRGIYELKTRVGSVDAPESPRETSDTIQVETISGDIRILP